MKTRFDHLSDDDVHAAMQAATTYGFSTLPHEAWQETDLEKIGRLSLNMYYWKSWIGPPVTFFDESGLNYDGHHRVRASKYIARRLGFQIHIPVRYDPAMREAATLKKETTTEVKQMLNDKVDNDCGKPSAPCVCDSLCQ